ncbi:MAG: uridine kinase, partial [Acidobacteria bacterium]
SFAEKLLDHLGPGRCVTIAQDAYYKDGSTLSPEERAAINYDHPDAFDTSLLIQDLRDLKAGRPVPQLTYDHASYARRVLADPLTPRPVILLEGILILAEEPLRRLMDIKLFIDTDADVRILRRLRRDLKERGRTFESVEKQYLGSVRPMHLEFVEPSKRYADLIVPEGAENQVALDLVAARVAAMLAR